MRRTSFNSVGTASPSGSVRSTSCRSPTGRLLPGATGQPLIGEQQNNFEHDDVGAILDETEALYRDLLWALQRQKQSTGQSSQQARVSWLANELQVKDVYADALRVRTKIHVCAGTDSCAWANFYEHARTGTHVHTGSGNRADLLASRSSLFRRRCGRTRAGRSPLPRAMGKTSVCRRPSSDGAWTSWASRCAATPSI